MPSARSDADAEINGYIIAMLEKAARLDPSLPFPKKEYEEVCRLHGCPPIPTDGMPEYVCGFPIGYRRGKVGYKVGKFSFTVPGSYLKETEGNTLILYDGDDETWHTVRCTAFSTEGTPDFPDMEEERIAEGEITGGHFRLYDIGYSSDSDAEDDKPYPNYSCHVAGDGQFTLLTLCASDPDELKMLAEGVVSGMKLQEQPDINEKKILYYNEMDMEELKKQIAAWHELDDHQAIVDALEKIPTTERDCEMTGLLARAYNNLENYAKAVELLESVKEEGESDHSWNFRMGYALYFMNRNKEAISYFKKVQELNPEDEDAPEFIRYCNTEMPFRKRVEDFWEWFLANEAKLSEMVHARDENEADNFVEFIGQGANLISEDVHFNMGGDHEFTFSVEGWPDLFFLYSYVVSRMPDSLKGKWKFFPFNPGKQEPFRFKMYDTDVDMMDVQVAASYQEETNDFILTYYEKNLCALPEDKSWNVFYIMAEIMLGEGVTFQYIKTVEKAEKPQAGMIALPELRKHIEETLQAHDKKFIENPKDVYTTYKFAPKEADEELPLRYDVVIGSTCLNSLVAEYYQNTTELFDHINSFGAQAVYLNFPHHNGKDEDASSVLNFRHDLEDRINDEILVPEGLGLLLGGATGTESSYIDLLVFDFNQFADKVRVLLQEYPQYSFYLSDFRQNCRLFRLTEGEAEEESPVYDPELNPEDDTPRQVIEECLEETEKRESTVKDDGGESISEDTTEEKEFFAPEMYSTDEMEVIEKHIEQNFGKFDWVFHEKVSPDIHVDICILPPIKGRDYYTLVTMGMGAHRMNVPEELADSRLERAELVICLPSYWKMDMDHFKDERWYWPIRLLKTLARIPSEDDTWLGIGHTIDHQGSFAENTELCASILLYPPCKDENICKLPNGDDVNFYQVLPLYRDEVEYKKKNGTDSLLDKMDDDILIVQPNRLNVLNRIALEEAPVQAKEISGTPAVQPEVIAHIEKHFGKIFKFLHDSSSPEYPLDIAVIAPRKEHEYYTLITVGMSEHRVLESKDVDGATCRQELLINLPAEWSVEPSDWTDEKQYWPVRLMLSVARQCIRHKGAIWWGQMMELEEGKTFAENTHLCAVTYLSPGVFGESSFTCKIKRKGNVEFYQVIPLYAEELQLARDKDIDELLDFCPDETLENINPTRLNAVTDAEKIGYDAAYMDDAEKHKKKIEDLHLQTDELAPYNHMAIYLRWCMEHDFMSRPFLYKHQGIVDAVKAGKNPDLRIFLRDNEDLHGELSTVYLNRTGAWFTLWYNWEDRSKPYAYIKDIQAYAIKHFKDRHWNNEEEKDAAYLLLPWTEKYYRDMAELISSRFDQWEDEPRIAPASLHIPPQEIKPLLKDWNEAIECSISHSVLVDGCDIAICFRQKPSPEDRGWDSGWVFLAAEDENSDDWKYDFCDLNTACNYSSDIMEYLKMPFDTRLVRGEDGKFYEEEDDDE